MAKQGNLKVVLFDFDGTLIFLPVNYQRIRNRLGQLFKSFNIYSSFHPLVESIRYSLAELRENGEFEAVITQVEKKAFAIIEEEELLAVENAVLAEGAKEVLLALKTNNISLAIVSGNCRCCIQRCLLAFNLPEPDLIVAREDTNQLKPHPEPFQRALKKLKMTPSEAIIIGDSYRDIDGGKNLDIKTILITPYANTVLEDHLEPDFKIKRLDEMFTKVTLETNRDTIRC